VFENKVLRRIFGPKREEVAEDQGKMYNEELCNFYSSPNIIRVRKSARMRWAGHVACVGEMRNAYILVGNPEGKRLLGRIGIHRGITLEWIFRKLGGKVWTGFI